VARINYNFSMPMTPTQARGLTRQQRLLWFVLPGLLLVGVGVLVVRFVEAHPPGERGVPGFSDEQGLFGPEGGHIPRSAYHLDLAIGLGLIGAGAVLVLTGLVWHAVSAKNAIS
jgi:hypothetical protein